MAICYEPVPSSRKNSCAVNLMRNMLIKYSQQKSIPFADCLTQFTQSATYDLLFDFDTEVWKEGPDYLLELFSEEQEGKTTP